MLTLALLDNSARIVVSILSISIFIDFHEFGFLRIKARYKHFRAKMGRKCANLQGIKPDFALSNNIV